jgi:hypothetical protein
MPWRQRRLWSSPSRITAGGPATGSTACRADGAGEDTGIPPGLVGGSPSCRSGRGRGEQRGGNDRRARRDRARGWCPANGRTSLARTSNGAPRCDESAGCRAWVVLVQPRAPPAA